MAAFVHGCTSAGGVGGRLLRKGDSLKRFVVMLLAIGLVVGSFSAVNSSGLSDAERAALRFDAALDRLERPEDINSADAQVLAIEIAPYFEYEGLTGWSTSIPEVVYEPQLEAMGHNHLLGYTFCEDEVYLNARYVNWTSAWYNRPDFFSTLVHEMIHTLGGDFCTYDSAWTESRTQLATLEVMAAMANHGNAMALYALLDELRAVAMGTALAEAIEADDLDRYRWLHSEVYDGDPIQRAKFEKSMRFWSPRLTELRALLAKYDVAVFADFQDFRFQAEIPGGLPGRDVILMDDLQYLVDNLDDMTEDR